MAYLEVDELVEVRDAALAGGLADPARRPMLFAGVMPQYVGVLPMHAAPLDQVHHDLLQMNQVERLIDGRVPLELWLRNAKGMTAHAAAVEVLDAALERVTGEANGEPAVPREATEELPEALVFRDDTVPFDFLALGAQAGSAVALLTVPQFEGGERRRTGGGEAPPHLGTGWLVTADRLMTNHHVVRARTRTESTPSDDDLRRQGAATTALFDFDHDGPAPVKASFAALEAWDAELDYAVLRLAARVDRRPLPLAAEPLVVGEDDVVPVNIIQHPGGRLKRVGLRNNLVERATASRLRYFTDTNLGSSGSPVLDDDWHVVALHRASERVRVEFQGRQTSVVNVGTPIHTVLEHLADRHPGLHAEITGGP